MLRSIFSKEPPAQLLVDDDERQTSVFISFCQKGSVTSPTLSSATFGILDFRQFRRCDAQNIPMYAFLDKAFAKKLFDRLNESKTRNIWADWEDIATTADLLSEIYIGIENSDCFVCILSAAATKDEVLPYSQITATALQILPHTIVRLASLCKSIRSVGTGSWITL